MDLAFRETVGVGVRVIMPPAADADQLGFRAGVGTSGYVGDGEVRHGDHPTFQEKNSEPETELAVQLFGFTDGTLASTTDLVEGLQEGSSVKELLGDPAHEPDDLFDASSVNAKRSRTVNGEFGKEST